MDQNTHWIVHFFALTVVIPPDLTMDTELSHSKSTTLELNGNDVVPAPHTSSPMITEQSSAMIMGMSTQHSLEAISAPQVSSSHDISRTGCSQKMLQSSSG